MIHKSPVVSVIMLTYNHEDFVQAAIEGVLNQQCNFDYELIICNDCSTDKTEEVIFKIIKDHFFSERIKYFKNSNNIGMQKNLISALCVAKGKYITFCEGDDFWTDVSKLQTQVEILESDPSLSISYHRVNYLYENSEIYPEILNKSSTTRRYNILDLAMANLMHTPSVMFRSVEYDDTTLEILSTSPASDYVLNMFNAKFGDIHYTPTIMATYRLHQHSVWSSLSKFTQLNKWRQVLELMIPAFTGKIREQLEIQFIRTNYDIFKEYIKEWKTRNKNAFDHKFVQFDKNYDAIVKELFVLDIKENMELKEYVLKSGVKTAFTHLKIQLKIWIYSIVKTVSRKISILC